MANSTGTHEKSPDGCGVLQERQLQHDGLDRNYLVYRPCQKTLRAVLLSIHCFGGNAKAQATPFIAHAEEHGFVLLAPTGVEWPHCGTREP